MKGASNEFQSGICRGKTLEFGFLLSITIFPGLKIDKSTNLVLLRLLMFPFQIVPTNLILSRCRSKQFNNQYQATDYNSKAKNQFQSIF